MGWPNTPGRYQPAGSQLAAAGIDTYAFDFQGFGASAGHRADIENWSIYLHQVLDNLVPLFRRNLPVVLLGHSIGGLIAVDYTLSRYRQPDLVVLNAPALDAVVPAWKRIGAPLLAGAVPRLTLANPINPTELFIDPAMAEDYRRDPLCVTRTTVRLGDIIFERMERVGRSLDMYEARTLLLHGGADSLVPPEVSEALGRRPTVETQGVPGHAPCVDQRTPGEALGRRDRFLDPVLRRTRRVIRRVAVPPSSPLARNLGARPRGVAMVATAGLLWSTLGLGVRLMDEAGPWRILFYRAAFQVVVLGVLIAARNPRAFVRTLAGIGYNGLLSAASLSFSSISFVYALSLTTVAEATLILGARAGHGRPARLDAAGGTDHEIELVDHGCSRPRVGRDDLQRIRVRKPGRDHSRSVWCARFRGLLRVPTQGKGLGHASPRSCWRESSSWSPPLR